MRGCATTAENIGPVIGMKIEHVIWKCIGIDNHEVVKMAENWGQLCLDTISMSLIESWKGETVLHMHPDHHLVANMNIYENMKYEDMCP